MKKLPDVQYIRIRGARVHNLKNISVDIPRNKLVAITGISGSGKSSLAFDTLYADGQRRYVESLSAYARQFLGTMEKPDVDAIEGISPAIAIDQKSVPQNPRSTVGTITEIYDYVRLLFARVGIPHCPNCGREVARQTATQIIEQLLAFHAGTRAMLLAPIIRGRKGEYRGTLEEIGHAGFMRVRIDGIVFRVEEALARQLERNKKHDIEVVVDEVEILRDKDMKLRVASSVETALRMGNGLLMVQIVKSVKPIKIVSVKENNLNRAQRSNNFNNLDILYSEHFACEPCGISLPELEPQLFSFNSPKGACPVCTGIGYQLEFDPKLVVPNERLSIAEGAIKPWMHASHRVGRQSWYWVQLNDLAERNGFSLHGPWKDLPSAIQHLILYGSAVKNVKVDRDNFNNSNNLNNSNNEFEGVIPNLMRRYKDSDSEYTRGELEQYMVTRKCPVCQGKRLKQEALSVTVAGKHIDEVSAFTIRQAQEFFQNIAEQRGTIPAFAEASAGKRGTTRKTIVAPVNEQQLKIAKPIAKEVLNRLQFLVDVGLDYLSLDRSSVTLAGGEAQRIRLATQIGTKLVGVLYILDEPSVGLHPRDQARLIDTLNELRNLGNSVIVVEHDPQTVVSADWVIDVGPGAGKRGGRITFEGTPAQLLRSNTLTGEYLSRKREISNLKSQISKPKGQIQNYLTILGAKEHNLKNIDVKIPLGKFVCLTGVSGSGKSTLMNDILAKSLSRHFWGAREEPGVHDRIEGFEHIDKSIFIDQSPIGRTPRSNPATYTGAFSALRDLFTKTKEAKIRGYSAGRFSFNVKGGRCEACQGEGMQQIEMHFLPDVWVECAECQGARYNKETLEIDYRGKTIAEVLAMTIEEAEEFFRDIIALQTKLTTLAEVGLGYMQLGQAATTLSGGEAQRVKLATELSRRATGRTLYLLDEPTTGLHPHDIEKLLHLLFALVEKGNTVLVIEHNLDVIRNADWIIDLGPEGGKEGGRIVAQGTPEMIAKNAKSYTGQHIGKLKMENEKSQSKI